jgi:3-hydroxyacyl-[acyl-carrier-protein] dehydratase
MLVENLYRIIHLTHDSNSIRADLEIDSSHEIFKGHFPSIPILPGVCMVQCIKELIDHTLGIRTRIEKADMIKFISMLNPLESTNIHADIVLKDKSDTRIVFQATLKNNEQILLKYAGSLLAVK